MELSIVIPVLNEAPSLRPLVDEILDVCRDRYDLQIVLIDDGSTDSSWHEIEQLAAEHTAVKGVRLRKNFGKAAALQVGFLTARPNTLITLDADLQDDPHEIPHLLAALDDGLDLVSGWKKVRHDPWHKVVASHAYNWLVSTATGVRLHDHNCGVKAYRPGVVAALNLYGQQHRMITVLAAAAGFNVGEVIVNHRARQFGSSKYGLARFFHGLLDLATVNYVTRYGNRPLHFFAVAALALVVVACLFGFWDREGWAAAFFVGALQLVAIGLVAESLRARVPKQAQLALVAEKTRAIVQREVDAARPAVAAL